MDDEERDERTLLRDDERWLEREDDADARRRRCNRRNSRDDTFVTTTPGATRYAIDSTGIAISNAAARMYVKNCFIRMEERGNGRNVSQKL